MIIAGLYSFKGGRKFIAEKYPKHLEEIEAIIAAVEAKKHKTKESKEKTMSGRILYNPKELNRSFKAHFHKHGWKERRVTCQYSVRHYVQDYKPKTLHKGAFREIDFIKDKLGVEIQFGKYAFMVYNVCAKMTIFNKMKYIDAGVEIVPAKQFADEMSTGVSYFEQIVWDLEQRGIADIDIPVLIYGIDA